jgi:hypothetical protein
MRRRWSKGDHLGWAYCEFNRVKRSMRVDAWCRVQRLDELRRVERLFVPDRPNSRRSTRARLLVALLSVVKIEIIAANPERPGGGAGPGYGPRARRCRRESQRVLLGAASALMQWSCAQVTNEIPIPIAELVPTIRLGICSVWVSLETGGQEVE